MPRSVSRCSAPRRRARAIRPAAPATSSCSRCWPRPTVETINGAFGERTRRKIVVTCPHCFNTLGNEYGDLGGHYEVIHHTQLLNRLVRDRRLIVKTPTGPRQPHATSPTTTRATWVGTTRCTPRRAS